MTGMASVIRRESEDKCKKEDDNLIIPTIIL